VGYESVKPIYKSQINMYSY